MAEQAAVHAEPESDAQYADAIEGFFRNYQLKVTEPAADTVDGRFRIEGASPLPDFDTKTARAYAAADGMDPGKSLYALVCEPGTVQRHRLIEPLKSLESPGIIKPVAAGTIPLSQLGEERFVLVLERPPGQTLAALAASRRGRMGEEFLRNGVISPIAAAIDQLAQLGLSHGRIHPDNIYFTDRPALGECLSAPCGLEQPFTFEPVERMQALAAGKGEGDTSHDYYALAVLVLYLMHGPEHFADFTPESLSSAILREGAYNALTRGKNVPEVFDDFLRGMLCQHAGDRWSFKQIQPWLGGKRYNMLLPPLPVAARPFEFGGRQATSRRELAQVLFADWKHLPTVLENGTLAQWVNASLKNKELAETVQNIGKAVADGGRNETQTSEQLMRLLMLLDEEAPIRIGELAMHADGIDTLSAGLFARKADKELQLLARFIEFNMLNYWLDVQRKDPDFTIPATVNTLMIKTERLRVCIRNTGLGFGLERMLYELNPEMPCQSPFFSGYAVTALPALLARLDQQASSRFGGEDPVDRHVAAFIGSHVRLQHELRLPELASMPALGTHRAVLALKFLALAQQKCADMRLPGLTHWLALRILPALDAIRNRSLRRQMKASLAACAPSGSLKEMAELIINPDYPAFDQSGFARAHSLYQSNAMHIVGYRKGENIDAVSGQLGLVMSKLFAYAALAITLFSVTEGF